MLTQTQRDSEDRVRLSLQVLLTGLALLTPPALADEGMWTTNGFPSALVAERYGFSPDQAWLDHLRLSSVRLAAGCSGSFASADGLVVTNHHCSVGCIERVSSAEHDYVANGFFAARATDELRCPGMEVNVLVGIDDVTERVRQATAGRQGQQFSDARRAVFAELERACATSDQAAARNNGPGSVWYAYAKAWLSAREKPTACQPGTSQRSASASHLRSRSSSGPPSLQQQVCSMGVLPCNVGNAHAPGAPAW